MVEFNADLQHRELILPGDKEVVGVAIPPTTNGRGIVLVCVYNSPASDLFSEDFYFLDFLN